MSTQIENLLELAGTFGEHLDITHWAVSMRATGKGTFFQQRMKGRDIHTQTADRVLSWFSENWPEDLEWPPDIPRPKPKTKAA